MYIVKIKFNQKEIILSVPFPILSLLLVLLLYSWFNLCLTVWARVYRWWVKSNMCVLITRHSDRECCCWTVAHSLYILRWRYIFIWWKSIWAVRNGCWSSRGICFTILMLTLACQIFIGYIIMIVPDLKLENLIDIMHYFPFTNPDTSKTSRRTECGKCKCKGCIMWGSS